MANDWNMESPCDSCPFRSDVQPFIHHERAREILEAEGTFSCHKTVDDSDDVEDCETSLPGEDELICAGFLILLEKEAMPNQMIRVAQRLKLYDPTTLNFDAPVYETIEECVAIHQEMFR